MVVRNATGFVLVNQAKCPNGLGPVVEFVHALGLKYDHYTDEGEKACYGD